jgi:tRNA nucleotidyltransferase (CCA-adding enzyme)
MALLSRLPQEEVERWAAQMRFRKQDTRILLQGVFEAPKVLKTLSSGARLKNSEVYALLKGLSQEALTYTFARSSQKSVRQRIIFYLANLKNVRLSVSGRDLNRMGFEPSPLYQVALESLLKAKLDGLVRSREEELNFISERLRKLEKGVAV